MEINILGTEYLFITNGTEEEYPDLVDNDGYCNYQLKQIVISSEDGDGSISYSKYLDKVARHEIVHAFLYESGLHEYAVDETLVDWIAIQLPKMSETFNELNI